MVLRTLKRFLWVPFKHDRMRGQNAVIPFHLSREISRLLEMVRPYTMIDSLRLSVLYGLACEIASKDIEGDIVECGVCQGGSAALIAHVFRNSSRKLWLYDTFEGMPPPSPEDGDLAQEYKGKCVGHIDRVKEVLGKVGYPLEQVVWRKGLFSSTFKLPLPEKIALLHIDADWYQSVYECLEYLYDRVVDGGVIILDDFGHWEGARKAFYDFCKTEGICPLLERVGYTQAFWWKGREHNRDSMEMYRYGVYWPFG